MTRRSVDWCEVLGSDCHSFRSREGTGNTLHLGQDGVSRRSKDYAWP